MKNNWKMKLTVLFIAAVTMLAACNDDETVNVQAPVPNIAQIIAQSPNFTLLNQAVVKANLSAALASPNLTVFAPDDAAFAAAGITSATISSLPVIVVDSILKYHVLGQAVPSASVPVSDSVRTILGTRLFLSRNVNGVFANGLKVKQADIKGSNGYIHVIENVLRPPTASIAQILAADTTYSMLVAAVTKVGLLTAISGPAKYTVFAPNNAAFRAAGITDINAVPPAVLDAVVKYHVLGTNVFASDLQNNTTVATVQGGSITVFTTPSAAVKITGSAQPLSGITAANIKANNGVIHAINRVMLP